MLTSHIYFYDYDERENKNQHIWRNTQEMLNSRNTTFPKAPDKGLTTWISSSS